MTAAAGNTTAAVWNTLQFQISYLCRDTTVTNSTVIDRITEWLGLEGTL